MFSRWRNVTYLVLCVIIVEEMNVTGIGMPKAEPGWIWHKENVALPRDGIPEPSRLRPDAPGFTDNATR